MLTHTRGDPRDAYESHAADREMHTRAGWREGLLLCCRNFDCKASAPAPMAPAALARRPGPARGKISNCGQIEIRGLFEGELAVEPVAAFTQADIDAGRVLFVHDGGDSATASFDVIVADDSGATSGAFQTVHVHVRS